ncbi:MAG: hypothetical protein U1F43_13385 [Myxococcota bacterium]
MPGATEATCSADPASDATCSLSFDRDVAPFDLIAIVNRTDLRVVPDGTRGGHASAGQGRFVFTLVDQASRAPLPLTVIFEYMVPAHTLADIQTYAKGWHDIGGAAWGRALNDKVHAQTVKFTAQNIARWRQNGSALLQLRTNDVILAPPGSDPSHPFGVMWQLREWVLGSDGQLTPDAVKQEPRIDLSGSALLTQWVNANANGILLNSYEVPYSFGGQSFMAASSIVPFDFVWDVPGVAENVRDAFALGTCNGCHRNETGTLFLHVFPTAAGVEATKSDWLAAQYASQSAPRVADLIEVLDKDFAKLKSGKGKDKGHSPDD